MWFISENYFYCVTALAMPPKADYWKYFNVVGVVAYCLIAECKQPNVSLGAIKLDVQVFDCTSNVNSSGAALLCCWTDIGRKEKQAGPILGWSHPLPTRSFLAGNVQAWMGVKCTPLVLVLHVIVHNLHLNKWCDQLLSIRRSWSLKIPLWRFGICTYCAGSSTCGGESFDNIQCVQKSPQLRT